MSRIAEALENLGANPKQDLHFSLTDSPSMRNLLRYKKEMVAELPEHSNKLWVVGTVITTDSEPFGLQMNFARYNDGETTSGTIQRKAKKEYKNGYNTYKKLSDKLLDFASSQVNVSESDFDEYNNYILLDAIEPLKKAKKPAVLGGFVVSYIKDRGATVSMPMFATELLNTYQSRVPDAQLLEVADFTGSLVSRYLLPEPKEARELFSGGDSSEGWTSGTLAEFSKQMQA